MTENKGFSKEEVKKAAENLLEFLELKSIRSIKDLRHLHDTPFRIGDRGRIVVTPFYSGSMKTASTITYTIDPSKIPVFEVGLDTGSSGGYIIFRCTEKVEQYHPMSQDEKNTAQEKIFGRLTPKKLGQELEQLCGFLS